MSNSVHRQWIKQACLGLLDPSAPLAPLLSCVPLQVTEVRPVSGSSSSSSCPGSLRVLLSDKQLKLWAVLSPGSIASLTRGFPEFAGSFEQAALITGGIILPLRYSLRLGASLREIILLIDEFAYKGGAGNNEFASPLFHMDDADVQASVARARNMDMTAWMDKQLVEADGGAAAAASSSSAAAAAASDASSRVPFVASLRSSISSFLSDPRHHRLETAEYISAEQQHALDAIKGFQRATLTSGFTQVEGTQMEDTGAQQHTYDETDAHEGAAAAASQRGGDGGGEPDDTAEPDETDETMGAAAAAGFGREFTQAPETVDFSQFPSAQHQQVRAAIEQKAQAMQAAPPAAAAAAAAAASSAPPPPPVPQFSATQLMIKGLMRAEAPASKNLPLPSAAPTIAVPALPSIPPAVAAAARATTFVIHAPLSASSNKAAAAISAKAAAAKQHSPLKAVVEAPVQQEEEKSQPALSQHSPRASQRSPARSSASPIRPSLRPSISSAPASPARNSLSVPVSPARINGGGEDAAAPESMHNLLPNSLDPSVGRLLTPTPEEQEPGAPAAAAAADEDELDEDEARQYEQEESQFPFLTQAPHGSPSDDEDEEEGEGEGEQEEGEGSRPPRHPAPILPPIAKSQSGSANGGSEGPVPMEMDSQHQPHSQGADTTPSLTPRPLRPLVPASHTPSPSSLRIPPTPSPGSSAMSSAKTSPQPAAAAAAASYSASSIAQRQQEREQRIQQQMEEAEKARVAEAQRVQQLKDEETARLAKLEEERQAKLRAEAAAEAARQAAAAEKAETERARAAEAAAAAEAEEISEDEDAYEAAAMLGAPAAAAASTSNKRGRPAAPAGSSAAAASASSAVPPPAKKARLPRGVGFGSATLPPTPSGGIVFVEDRVRAALEALEKHKGGGPAASTGGRGLRMQPLKLVTTTSSATPRAHAASSSTQDPVAAAAASPTRGSTSAVSSSRATAAAVPSAAAPAAAAAVSPSSSSSLPLFVDRKPVGLAEVQCALRYFHSIRGKAKQSPLRAMAAKASAAAARSASAAVSMEDDEEASAPGTRQPQDPEYSQCF